MICLNCGSSFRLTNLNRSFPRFKNYCSNCVSDVITWIDGSLQSHRIQGIKINITTDEVLNKVIETVHCSKCGIYLNPFLVLKNRKGNLGKSPVIDRMFNEDFMDSFNVQIICFSCNSSKSNATFPGENIRSHRERKPAPDYVSSLIGLPLEEVAPLFSAKGLIPAPCTSDYSFKPMVNGDTILEKTEIGYVLRKM